MKNDPEWIAGLEVAARTRTIRDVVALLIETGMDEAEILDTVRRVALHATRAEALKRAH